MKVTQRASTSHKDLKRLLFWYGLILCSIVIMYFSARGLVGMYKTYTEVAKYAEQAEKRYTDLEQRKLLLTRQIGVLATPLGQEIELRKKYGFGKNGEGVMVFVENE